MVVLDSYLYLTHKEISQTSSSDFVQNSTILQLLPSRISSMSRSCICLVTAFPTPAKS